MSRELDAATSEAVLAWLRFNREMGLGDLCQREAPAELVGQLKASAASPTAPRDTPSHDLAYSHEHEPAASPSQHPDVALHSAAAMAKPEDFAPPAAAARAPMADRAAGLRVIREDLGECTRCPLHQLGRKQIVFGVGDAQARLMFVGEGPGADEDEQGEPFVGRAGQLLNNMIQAMGLQRAEVYIGNVVKCRPPQNRTPEPVECETCSPFLMRQIAVIRPEIIVALGATAAKTLLAVNDTMAHLRGHIYDFHPSVARELPEHDAGYGCKLVVTYHPAYLLRDPRQKREAWRDLQMVMQFLGLPLPKAGGGA